MMSEGDPSDSEGERRGQPLVLICDDEVGPREALRILLKDQYEVHLACDGMEAVEQCENLCPNLIIMDIRMRRLDGLEAVRRIRASGNSVPIIVMTGFPDLKETAEARNLGVLECLIKPFDLLHLGRLVEESVRGGLT
jgi:CheY-like chemotaxis protein